MVEILKTKDLCQFSTKHHFHDRK